MIILQFYFPKIIFQEVEDEESVDPLVPLDNLRMIPRSVFDDYYYRRKKLESYFFYNYMKVISHIKYSARQKSNILFNSYHFNPLSKI